MTIPTTLPAAWYCNQNLQQLERRAIFLRAWYFLGTLRKFESGQELRFEVGQIVLMARTEDMEYGKRVRFFDEAAGQEVPSHQTKTGLVFSTISSEAPPFDEYFPGLTELVDEYEFTKIPYRKPLSYEGKYNWKTMMDGFQECLHCQFAHPGLTKLYPPTFYRVENHHNWSRHFTSPDRSINDGLFLYFFPTTTLNMYNGGMSSFRVCPTRSPGKSRMEYDYYHQATGAKFDEYYKFVREVADEDNDLCELAQANLKKGVYVQGCLNPEKEGGVIYYQQRVLDLVMNQHHQEMQQV